MNTYYCEICEKESTKTIKNLIGGADFYHINCPNCGNFVVSYTVIQTMDDFDDLKRVVREFVEQMYKDNRGNFTLIVEDENICNEAPEQYDVFIISEIDGQFKISKN